MGRSGASRLCRVSHSNEVDVCSAQHFVNSSLAPVFLFRRRLKSADVLKGIRNHGFGGRPCWVFWMLFVVMVRVVRSALHPWDGWVPLDLHGFYRWVFDSLAVLSDLAGCRRSSGHWFWQMDLVASGRSGC